MKDQELTKIVLEKLKQVAPDADLDHLDKTESFRDQLDLDSMDQLNFVVALHEAVGVDIPERDYSKLETVADCVTYLQGRV